MYPKHRVKMFIWWLAVFFRAINILRFFWFALNISINRSPVRFFIAFCCRCFGWRIFRSSCCHPDWSRGRCPCILPQPCSHNTHGERRSRPWRTPGACGGAFDRSSTRERGRGYYRRSSFVPETWGAKLTPTWLRRQVQACCSSSRVTLKFNTAWE